MALLPAFLRSSRSVRRAPRVAGRPSSEDEPVLDAADDRLSPALVAAGRGEYRPAAALLAATRTARDWEDRDGYARRLAAFARSRPEWFGEWGAADPGDPGLRLVAAQLAVDRAWSSPARAELLREVSPLITAAARAEDRDPVPWRIALDHARGSRAGHGYFGELWEAAVRRSPHHYGCHVAALRYLSVSWRGSHHECFDFADRAAQDAPADSLLQALPVRAAFGYLTVGGGTEVPRARLDAATDRAAALSALLPAADPRAAETRNLLACVLVRLGRRREALVQLRLTGPYATSFPWERESDDPLGHFLRLREDLAAADREEAAGPGPGPVPVPAAGPRGPVAPDDH